MCSLARSFPVFVNASDAERGLRESSFDGSFFRFTPPESFQFLLLLLEQKAIFHGDVLKVNSIHSINS